MNNAPAPALVLGSEPRVAVTIARSLHRHGIPVDVCRLGNEPDIVSTSIRRRFVLPAAPIDAVDLLLKAVREQRYSYIMPTSDTALAILLQGYEALSLITGLSCPSPDRVKSVLDKNITLRIARKIGVPTPRVTLDDITGPMIVKPADKAYQHSFKVRYFATVQQYKETLASDSSLGQGVMVQEFVSGDGVGVEVLMHKGKCISAFQHRRIRELPWSGGVGVVAVSEPLDPILYQYTLRLLDALGWEGIAMAEFRHDPITGASALIEVNGRYFGSLSLSNFSGIDFPLYDWQIAHGEEPTPVTHYRHGLRWRWSAGVLYRIRGIRNSGPSWIACPAFSREIMGLVRDFLPSTRDALWTWRDPLPALMELLRALAGIARSLSRSLLNMIIPRSTILWLRYWHHMDPAVRRPLIRLHLRRGLGIQLLSRRILPKNIRSILFVCHGNIIRSAFSEAWLKERLGPAQVEIRIQSAGLRAINGKPADPRAVIAAREVGIDLGSHQAQLLTRELVEESDLIVVMDYLNEANLLARYPWARSRIRLMAECGGGRQVDEVADPYNGDLDAVRTSYQRLQQYLNRFATHLTLSNL